MPRHEPVALADVNLANVDSFAERRGFAQFDVLRAEDPVHWTPLDRGEGFWSVTRYADIWAVDKNPEMFTSEEFVNLEDVDEDLRDFRRSMLEMDGPRHIALRRLLQREFSPRKLMHEFEGFLRELTKATVDRALAVAADSGGEVDFVDQISADFPIQVLARMLGVPELDTAQLISWGNALVANTDPDFATVQGDAVESEKYRHLPFRSPTVQEVWDYGNELKAQRLGGDGTDLISILANKVPEDGIPLSPQDFNNYFTLLVLAGNETTRHAISSGMLGLIEHPDQLRLLQKNPGVLDTAVEELLRWSSPVYHFRRTATRDVELGGKQILAGQKVVMWFASGNFDDAEFDEPYRLDVTRTDVDHLTFGKGSPHLCIGNGLARLELRLLFQELITRIANIEQAGDIAYLRSNFINGIKAFPVKITARS